MKWNNRKERQTFNLIEHHILIDRVLDHLTTEKDEKFIAHEHKQNTSKMSNNIFNLLKVINEAIEGNYNFIFQSTSATVKK
jgi:hypothetical protein